MHAHTQRKAGLWFCSLANPCMVWFMVLNDIPHVWATLPCIFFFVVSNSASGFEYRGPLSIEAHAVCMIGLAMNHYWTGHYVHAQMWSDDAVSGVQCLHGMLYIPCLFQQWHCTVHGSQILNAVMLQPPGKLILSWGGVLSESQKQVVMDTLSKNAYHLWKKRKISKLSFFLNPSSFGIVYLTWFEAFFFARFLKFYAEWSAAA